MKTDRQSSITIAHTRHAHRNDQRAAEAFVSKLAASTEDPTQDDDAPRISVAPARTSAEALLMLKGERANTAIIPFFDPHSGYKTQELREMAELRDVVATELIRYRPRLVCISAIDANLARPASDQPDQTVVGALFATRAAFAQCPTIRDRMAAQGATLIETPSDDESLAALRDEQRVMEKLPAIETHRNPLSAAIVPDDIVLDRTRFSILHDNAAEGAAGAYYFLAVRRARDDTAYFDKYRTTDARTRYFCRRMKSVLQNAGASMMGQNEDVIGVNVLLQLGRTGAGIGELESYLQNYGVRYHALQHLERDGKNAPAPILLDVEFAAADFTYDPRRRLRGAVANGALKLAFARWKKRQTLVQGAMPISTFRLPTIEPRRWWREGAVAALRSFAATGFIRFSRLLFFVVLAAAVLSAALILMG